MSPLTNGTEGQDRDSLTDTQDCESYSDDPTNEERVASDMAALQSQELDIHNSQIVVP